MKPREIPASNNPRVPAVSGPYRHYIPLQIRFSDIDMLGHLNNSVYVNFFDMGKTFYFREVLNSPLDWNTISVVIVNLNCNFHHPIYFHDSIEVFTKVESISERSITMDQRIVNTNTGETHASCRTVLAGFDVEKHVGIPIHPEWRRLLCEFEEKEF